MPINDTNVSVTSYAQQINIKQEELNDNKKTEKKEVEKKDASLLSRLLGDDKDSAKKDLTKASLALAPSTSQTKSARLQERIGQAIDDDYKDKESYEDDVKLTKDTYRQTSQTDQKKELEKKQLNQFSQESADADEKEKQLPQSKEYSGVLNKAQEKMEKTYTKNSQEQESFTKASKEEQHEQTKSLVKDYANLLSDYLTTDSPKKKQDLETLKQKMYQQGYGTKDVVQMDQKVGNLVRQQVAYELKNQVIKYLFSKGEGKVAELKSQLVLSDFLDDLSSNKALGNEDFGNFGGGLTELLRTQINDVKMGDFVLEEVDELFTQYKGVQDDQEKLDLELKKLTDKCVKIRGGVDLNAIRAKIARTIEDQGLFQFLPPLNENTTFNFSEGDPRGKKQNTTNYLLKEDTLEDKLRNLYFTKAFMHGIFAIKDIINLNFEIVKTKNDLLKLGVYSKELEENLQEQGIFLAKAKLLESLKKNFLEQATLFELKGPTYDIIKKRKKFCIGTLKKLGQRLSGEEYDKIRDEANREIFPIIKEQFLQVNEMENSNNIAGLAKKKKMLGQLLMRLKKESNIYDDLDLDDQVLSENKNIVSESA